MPRLVPRGGAHGKNVSSKYLLVHAVGTFWLAFMPAVTSGGLTKVWACFDCRITEQSNDAVPVCDKCGKVMQLFTLAGPALKTPAGANEKAQSRANGPRKPRSSQQRAAVKIRCLERKLNQTKSGN